ncbi:Aste57867_11272 [Aphanomyces stellatus]|uniref:Aste57867_11272 protein n=1 Tax=Aphanomyces stellatus TaxID=120398 RepID=A0A485KT20_9STRA|nr:hypothetical protein As57867_011230 [Aphanomyces stellatus]VFT88135.1 Aste57867_11272 [Aphanomyces stellatus]
MHSGHLSPHMNANAPPHIPNQSRHGGTSLPRGPPRVNPNVAPFVPQHQPSGYIPRAGQQQAQYYPPVQGMRLYQCTIRHIFLGGYMSNPMASQTHMYMQPHMANHMQYTPMQHSMGINPNIGIGMGPHGQNLPMSHAPPRPSIAPTREKKVLLIIDPKTNKPINECKSIPPEILEKPEVLPSTPIKKNVTVTSNLRATTPEFVLHSVTSSPKPPAPILSPVRKSPVKSSKPMTPTSSPKHTEPSLVFGTVEVVPDDSFSSPKSILTPPGFTEQPAADPETERKDEDDTVVNRTEHTPVKRIEPRPKNPTPLRNGKICYSIDFLYSFRIECKDLPATALEPDSGWLSMEVTNDGPSGRTNNRRMDRQNSTGGPASGQLQRQSSRGNNNEKSKQWQRDQNVARRSSASGGRGSNKMRQQTSMDDVPLKRSEDRWVPMKATSNLEKVSKQVQSIMNKMTNQKFDVLSAQLSEIDMESLDMLSAVITIIFDKALGEPHFCEMYANLCVRLEQHWKVWSFLQIVRHDDDDKWYWTTMSDTDAEVVGPFTTKEELFENAEEDPLEVLNAPDGLSLKEVRVRKGKFIKVWESNGDFFWSGQNVEDLGEGQVLNGPFETHDHANVNAIKTTSFKRILLNACQEEFEKDNIYEKLDEEVSKAREDGTLTSEIEASIEEKKMLTKRRMLGNIRFIGELYRKGMLQERIMHECVMKLMEVTHAPPNTSKTMKVIPLHPNAAPDEENIESLSKLLTTMGKHLETNGMYPGAMAAYFDYLSYLTKDKRLSSRINFMLLDVIDLRNNRWEPRRKELKQKTLDEIRKDAEKELAAQKRNNPPSRGVTSSTSGRDGGRSGTGGFRNNQMQAPPRSGFNLERSRSQQAEKVGGTQGRPASFSNFKGKGTPNSVKPAQILKPVKANVQKNIENQLSQVSEDIKLSIAKKTKSFLEEYVELKDVKEAVSCIHDLKTGNSVVPPLLVSSCVSKETLKLAVEAKDCVREAMFDVLFVLHSENVLETDAIQYGLESSILCAPDLSCDVPKIHEHLGAIISRFISVTSTINLSWLTGGFGCDSDDESYEELVESGVLSGIVGICLSLLPVKLAQLQSNTTFVTVNLTSILPSRSRAMLDVMQWMDKFGLDRVLPSIYKACEVVAHVKKTKNVREVIAWIECNVSGEVRKDTLFAKQICLFLLGLSNWDTPSADHCNLLMGLCGDVEGQTAFVGGIIQEVPTDKVKKLLSQLLDEHVISVQALMNWKEQQETAGDNSATSVRDFIEKLRK